MNDIVTAQRGALLAAGLTAVLWGLTGIFVRLLPPLSPLTVTAGRLFVALALAVPILAVSRTGWLNLKSAIRRPVAYVLASLLAGYYLLATTAFQLAPVAEVALLLSTPPLFVLAFRRRLGDIPASAEVIGAVFALAGIAFILAPRLASNEGLSDARFIGDVLAICASGLTAWYTYFYARLSESNVAPEPTGVAFLTFAVGCAVLGVVIGIVPMPLDRESLNANAALMFLGLGILCTAVPSLAFAVASKRLPSTVTASISLLIPLFAGIFAFFILGEGFSPSAIPGAVLVLGGIAMILRRNNRVKAGLTRRSTGRGKQRRAG